MTEILSILLREVSTKLLEAMANLMVLFFAASLGYAEVRAVGVAGYK